MKLQGMFASWFSQRKQFLAETVVDTFFNSPGQNFITLKNGMNLKNSLAHKTENRIQSFLSFRRQQLFNPIRERIHRVRIRPNAKSNSHRKHGLGFRRNFSNPNKITLVFDTGLDAHNLQFWKQPTALFLTYLPGPILEVIFPKRRFFSDLVLPSLAPLLAKTKFVISNPSSPWQQARQRIQFVPKKPFLSGPVHTGRVNWFPCKFAILMDGAGLLCQHSQQCVHL